MLLCTNIVQIFIGVYLGGGGEGTEFTDSGVKFIWKKGACIVNLCLSSDSPEPKCTFCHNKQTHDFNYSPLINEHVEVSNLS